MDTVAISIGMLSLQALSEGRLNNDTSVVVTSNESEQVCEIPKRMAIMNVYALGHVIKQCHDADDRKTELQIPPHECCFASTKAIRFEGAKHPKCPSISTSFCIPPLL